MARIRTVKPEMPASPSLALCTRDARLLAVWLITDADDDGRVAASAKRLAGTLYPHDDDVGTAELDAWLGELEAVGYLRLYYVNGARYLALVGWREHQRIQKPTRSRLPAPPVASDSGKIPEEVASDSGPRTEPSAMDLGPWTMDHGPRTTPTSTRSRQDPTPGYPQADAREAPADEGGSSITWPTAVVEAVELLAGDELAHQPVGTVRSPTRWLAAKRAELLDTLGPKLCPLAGTTGAARGLELIGVYRHDEKLGRDRLAAGNLARNLAAAGVTEAELLEHATLKDAPDEVRRTATAAYRVATGATCAPPATRTPRRVEHRTPTPRDPARARQAPATAEELPVP